MQRVVLEVPREFRFRAGQYLEVVHPRGTIPLSIASGPCRLPELHLHYRSLPGVREAGWMDELLEAPGPLTIFGPCGDVSPPDDSAVPLLLIAGGTGVSQVCAVLDELAGRPERAAVVVLWCADAPDDLYCRTELDSLRAPWLSIDYSVDARRDRDNTALQRIRSLGRRALADPALAGHWIMLSGSPGFVYAARDALIAVGIDASRLHADAFAWAPPPS